LSEETIWQLLTVNVPPIDCKLSAPMVVMFEFPTTETSPVTTLTLLKLRLSDVPVAMAIFPLKVVQDAKAEASPEFWTVLVP